MKNVTDVNIYLFASYVECEVIPFFNIDTVLFKFDKKYTLLSTFFIKVSVLLSIIMPYKGIELFKSQIFFIQWILMSLSTEKYDDTTVTTVSN